MKINTIVVGKYAVNLSPEFNLVEQVNVEFSTDIQECDEQLLSILSDAHAKDACVLFQYIPSILGMTLMRHAYSIGKNVGSCYPEAEPPTSKVPIGVLVTPHMPLEVKEEIYTPYYSNEAARLVDAVKFANPRADVNWLDHGHIKVRVEGQSIFHVNEIKVENVEWFGLPKQLLATRND